MQIKHEKYALGKSKNIEIISKDSDVKADLQLNLNENEINIGSSISGIVVDNLGIPIKNAVIKMMNNNLEILATTKTDSTGKYNINIIPLSNSYIIFATYIGKLLQQSPSFSLLNKENKIINFTLNNDNNSLLGAINGNLFDSIGNLIKGAVISLYKIIDSNSELIGITYSDFEGNFLFSELEPLKYKIVISTLNYLPYDEIISIENGKIYTFNKELKINPLISKGSITGIIEDNGSKSIANADVILYKVENNIKTPVAFTKSNSYGIYAFSNVPFGNYMIKSSASQNTNLENLITPSVKITSTLQLDTYNLSSGILENNALVDYSTGFVINVGGKNDGSVTLNVIVEKFGLYKLDIQYVSADFNRPLKLKVNGKDTGEIYKVPITSGWTIDNSKVFNIFITLNAGENIIKFHGDAINLAPNLGTVTFIFNETENITLFAVTSYNSFTYDVSKGTFGGGATVNTKTNFTDNLGGPDDGFSIVSVKVNDTMIYYLAVKYLASKANMNLKIDINNIKSNKIYSVTKTKSINVADALTFTIPIILNDGENTIKFHGDGVIPAPSLQKFVLTSPPLDFQLYNGILENGAKADITKNFVIGIGGKFNGSSTVRVNVTDKGKYKLFLKYVGTTTNLSLKVDVNGINTGTVYKLSPTKGLNFVDCETFIFDVNLNYGNNSLKFYGNNMELSPNLAFYSVKFNDMPTPITSTIPQEKYLISNATLRSSATYDKNSDLVISIGGKNNGSCYIGVMVKHKGEYVLTINYRNNNRKFKIDINDSPTNTIYETIGDFIDTFSTLINLKEGKNIIKFHGTGFLEDLAPDLGNFTLNLNAPINLRLSDGIFGNGAKILSSGIITSIGGPESGYFRINYFAPESGNYILDFIFSGEGTPIIININNDDSATRYNIPIVNTPTVSFNIKIGLNEGDNTINFYGDDETYAPNLYSIVIKKAVNLPIDSGYKFSQGELARGAKVDATGFVINVGGIKNGSVKLTVPAPSSDYYDIEIKYLDRYRDIPVKLDVNKTTYSFTLPFVGLNYNTKVPSFMLFRIYLDKNTNILKFYGNGINTVPPLGSLKIFKSPQPTTIPKEEVFYVKNGLIEAPALISRNISNFVENIGGSTKNGKKEGVVTVKIDNGKNNGLYNLVLQYLANSTNSNLAIDINGAYTGFIYTFPQTNGLIEADSKKFAIPIMLSSGVNSIKFRGDGTNYSPKLGQLEIIPIPNDFIYNVSEGYLHNGAEINPNTKFITKLGGIKNGSFTILINVRNTGAYYLTIKYLSPISDSSIKIDIINNTSNKSVIGKFTKTLSNEVKYMKILTLSINLLSGNNKLKFHGEGLEKNAITPDLQSFVITSIDYVKVYDIATVGIFSKGARKSSIPGFVTGLGGIKKGSIILDVDIDISGLYDLTFNYIEEKTQKTFTLTINEIKLPEVYKLPLGSSKSKHSINTYIIPIKLNKGKNLIKFSSKRGTTFGPTIGQVTLTLNKSLYLGDIYATPNYNSSNNNILTGYSASDGKLKNGAVVDSNTGFVTNIGGKDNGEVTVEFNSPIQGSYNLEIQVAISRKVAERGEACRLLLDINGTSTKREYVISTTLLDKVSSIDPVEPIESLIDILIVKVFFNEGKNSIRFYGNGVNIGPMLGKYTFLPISKTSNLKDIETSPNGIYYLNYDFADGTLGNGAMVDPSTGFVTNIGGKDNGFVIVEVYVYEEGIYSIIIEYLAFQDIQPFTMEINDVSKGNIFNLEKCTSYSKNKSFTETLKLGKNKFKFMGDGTHIAPDFGIITFILLSEKN